MGYWDLLDLLYIAEMYRRDDKPSPVDKQNLFDGIKEFGCRFYKF